MSGGKRSASICFAIPVVDSIIPGAVTLAGEQAKRQAGQELEKFKRNMSANRTATGERLVYPLGGGVSGSEILVSHPAAAYWLCRPSSPRLLRLPGSGYLLRRRGARQAPASADVPPCHLAERTGPITARAVHTDSAIHVGHAVY